MGAWTKTLVACLLTVGTARGEVLLRYEFGNQNATIYGSHIDASTVVATVFDQRIYNESGKEIDVSSDSGAPHMLLRDFSGGTYPSFSGSFTFTVTPGDRHVVNYSEFSLFASWTQNAFTMTLSYKVGAGDWVTVGSASPTGVGYPGTQTVLRRVFDISALQAIQESVSFKVVVSGPDNVIANFDDVRVDGLAVISAPSGTLISVR